MGKKVYLENLIGEKLCIDCMAQKKALEGVIKKEALEGVDEIVIKQPPIGFFGRESLVTQLTFECITRDLKLTFSEFKYIPPSKKDQPPSKDKFFIVIKEVINPASNPVNVTINKKNVYLGFEEDSHNRFNVVINDFEKKDHGYNSGTFWFNNVEAILNNADHTEIFSAHSRLVFSSDSAILEEVKISSKNSECRFKNYLSLKNITFASAELGIHFDSYKRYFQLDIEKLLLGGNYDHIVYIKDQDKKLQFLLDTYKVHAFDLRGIEAEGVINYSKSPLGDITIGRSKYFHQTLGPTPYIGGALPNVTYKYTGK